MHALIAIMQRDYKELAGSNAFKIILAVALVITVALAVVISTVLSRQPWVGEAAAEPLLELITSLVAYFLPFIILMAFIWSFSSPSLVKEKVSGNIECLLATPVKPHALWAGKCLAVFIPGFGVATASLVLVLLAINLAVINPATGSFVLPAPVMVTGFLVNPMLLLCLLCFITLFSLSGNPDTAIAPSFILGFGLMMGIPLGVATGVIDLASWAFTLWYLAATIAAWLITAILAIFLSKEKIVLSSKGS